jgi:hypothetical protein
MSILSDETIESLVHEEKTIPEGLVPIGKLVARNQHKRREYDVDSVSGHRFVVYLRHSELNIMDFSVILGYRLPHLHTVFRLRRYNGKHQHTNVLERQTFYDFHIHMATQRYQAPGFREDHFALTTARYASLESAIQCLIADCGFRTFEDTPLFGGTV